MKLFKLAWDMVGSEFAGRHQQYEKFYAGRARSSFATIRSARANWGAFDKLVDDFMAGYDHPAAERPGKGVAA